MKKIKQKLICFVLMIAMLITNLVTVFAVDETYYSIIDKEDIIPYIYENSSVTSSINSLIDRTENLKSNYALSEAISILRDLNSTVENITSSDYKNNYNIKHDENNYETGEFYKYKYGHVEWIERNIIYLILTNSSSSESELKEMIELLYNMTKLEMKNDALVSDSSAQLINLTFISDSFPSSLRDFVEFCARKVGYISIAYNEGEKPDNKTLEELYQEELNEQAEQEKIKKEIEENNAKVEFIEEETIVVEPFDETTFSNVEPIINTNSYTVPQTESMSSYIAKMQKASSQHYVTYKTYSIKNIYYTLDKTVENPVWNDSGISINEGEISYSKLLNVLSIIGRNDGYYFFEDSDMSMLIADGQNLILNDIETVTEEDVSVLFDKFDKLGIKVMLKSDNTVDTSNSLESKLESGEINEISVNGDKLILTNPPILTKNVLQLPIEQTAKELGYTVKQNGNTITLVYEEEIPIISENITDENETSESEEETTEEVIESNKVTIVLTVGSSNFTINGAKNSFKTPVTKENGVVYAEFDKLASKLGYNYSYNADTGVIEFTK